MSNRKFEVGILMGSKNDWNLMKEAAASLKQFAVSYDVRVISAHRTPGVLMEYLEQLPARGTKVLICGAGGAAHLAGVVAGHQTLPVIGVPIPSGSLQGLDSLLATVQMPKGIPVATVAVGGAFNAGILAVQMLALESLPLREKLAAYKKEMAESVRQSDAALQHEMAQN